MAWVKGAEPKRKRAAEKPKAVAPEPNPVSLPQVARMIDHRIFDPAYSRRATMLADTSIPLISAFAKAYTRGRGFTADGIPNEEIGAVITTASARLGANTGQTSVSRTESSGGTDTREQTVTDVRGFFVGWNLAELAVLNRYRRRAQ